MDWRVTAGWVAIILGCVVFWGAAAALLWWVVT